MKKIYKLTLTFIFIFLFNIEVKAATTEENVNSLITRLNNYEDSVFINSHPVGSIYMTTSNEENTAAKVANKYGGTWEAYGTDRVLRGTTGTAGSTGGASTVTLSTNNLPSHSHSVPAVNGTIGNTGSGYTLGFSTASRTSSIPNVSESISAYFNGPLKTEYTGSSYVKYLRNKATGSSGTISSSVLVLSNVSTHTIADYYASSVSGVQAHTHAFTIGARTTGATGSGSAFSILDPYITVYMYKRTA